MIDLEKTRHEESVKATAVYSPMQLSAGSILGGPLAGIYFLRANYLSLDNQEMARKVVRWGVSIYIALLIAVFFIPSDLFPDYMVTVMTSIIVYQIAVNTMPVKSTIKDDDSLKFQSKWRVFLIGLLIAFGQACAMFGVAFFFAMLM